MKKQLFLALTRFTSGQVRGNNIQHITGRVGLSLGVILLTSCTPTGDQSATTKTLQAKIQLLTSDVAALSKQQRISASRLEALEVYKNSTNHDRVELDPAEPGASRLDTGLGSFAVSLTDVRPFADGVKIKLELGNLTSAKFPGATLKLRYGARAAV